VVDWTDEIVKREEGSSSRNREYKNQDRTDEKREKRKENRDEEHDQLLHTT